MKKLISSIFIIALFIGTTAMFSDLQAAPHHMVKIHNQTHRSITVRAHYRVNGVMRDKNLHIAPRSYQSIFADRYTFVKIFGMNNRLLKTEKVNRSPEEIFIHTAR